MKVNNMNDIFLKSFLKNFATDFLINFNDYYLKNNSYEKITYENLYQKVMKLLNNKVTLSESQFKKMFDTEFYTIKELIEDAQSQHLNNVYHFISNIADIIIAKKMLISSTKVTINKEYSKLVYRMH